MIKMSDGTETKFGYLDDWAEDLDDWDEDNLIQFEIAYQLKRIADVLESIKNPPNMTGDIPASINVFTQK